jgi:hypothetical protein
LVTGGDELLNHEGVALNVEIETPILVNPGLSEIFGLVKLLGMQTGMVQVANEEIYLLDEGPLDRQRRRRKRFGSALRKQNVHRFLALALR